MKRFSMAMTWLALAGLMTMVSCRKPVIGFSGDGRVVTISAVTESGNGSKTAIDGLNVNWSVGDKISMNGSEMTLKEGAGTTKGVFEGTVTGTDPYYVGYPAEYISYVAAPLSFSINIPASWTYDVAKQIVPMVAVTNSVEGGLQFHNAVNMLKLQLKGDDTDASKLTSIVLTSTTSNLSGEISVTFDGEGNPTFAAIAGDGASKTMTVLFGDGLQLKADEVKCVYIPLAKISVDDVLTVRFNCANGKYMERKVTADANFNAVNNMLSDELTVNATTDPGYIQSEFTINGSGKKVYFSKGNLQYLGKAEEGHKWRFAEHQWDYMGAGPNAASNKGNVNLGSLGYSAYNTGSSSEAARDLFGWGCTGYQDTRDNAHTYQKNYLPYSTSTSEVNTSYNRYGYGPDYYDASKYGLSVKDKSDWGCNAIYTHCGDATGSGWRTLTSAEWKYLLDTRMVNGGKGEGKSYQRATINSDASDGSKVKGLLLYPDDYKAQTKAKSYTTEQWSAMESAGVVFLPAAGRRGGTSPSEVGDGYYWSSSCSSNQAAYCLLFYSSDVKPNSNKRYYGHAVRLVR